MLDKPISIVTINYNDTVGLERTIKSVVSQTFSGYEFIVIDGGSTDGSCQTVEKYRDKVSCFLSEPDKGIYDAMNKGIDRATSEYLLFLNSGDHFYKTDSLEKSLAYLDGTDIICFDWQAIGAVTGFSNYPSELSFFEFCYGGLPHQSTFIKRELFLKYGKYDENLKIVSDWKFFLEALFRYNSSYKKVNQVISCYYTDGISSKVDYRVEQREVIKNLFPRFEKDIENFRRYAMIVNYLQDSRKIRLLNKLGILDTDRILKR